MANLIEQQDVLKYLLSNAFERYVRQMTIMAIGAGLNIKFVQEHPCSCPRTNGEIIWYDPAPKNYLNKNLDLEHTVFCVLGDTFHEDLHVKYTIVEILQAIGTSDYVKSTMPLKYQLLMEKNVLNYVKTLQVPERKIVANLFNIIEDSAIEYCGKRDSKFVGVCLTLSNSILFTETKTVDEMLKENANDFSMLYEACMNYAIIGSTKGRLPQTLRETFKDELMPILKEGRQAKDSFERFEITKKVWEVLKRYYKASEPQQQSNYPKNSQQSGCSSTPSPDNFGSKFPVSDNTKELANETSKEKREQNNDGGQKDNENKEKKGDSSSSQSESLPNETSNRSSSNDSSSSKSNEQSLNDSSNGNGNMDGNSKNEKEEDWEKIDETNLSLGGMTKEELKECLTQMKNFLTNVTKNYKLELVEDEKAKQEEFENKMSNRNINYPNSLHSNCRVSQNIDYARMGNKELYNKIVHENSAIINSFVSKIKTVINNRRDKIYYSRRGKLAQEKLYKVSFSQRTYKKVIESDKPDKVCIVVLIDRSGSMNGDRIENAIKASVVLTEACEKLDIPISIVAHNANYPDFNLSYYKRFEGKKDKYSIPTLNAGGCNRDGLALLYAGEMLQRRPEPIKLLLSITDGQPSDKNYSGLPAKEDMLEIGEMLRKKHVLLTGIAISGYKEGNDQIAKCYKNSVSIEDVSLLPKELLKILKPLL